MLVTLELLTMYLMYKSYNHKNILDSKIETKEKMAIKVDDGTGKYESKNQLPGEGYVLNKELTECKNQEGKKVENLKLTSNGENITITSSKTLYCTLYFDLPENREYDYTGDYQVFMAPKEGDYQIELWGASGGGAYYNFDNVEGYVKSGDYINGGKGAYTKGIIHLSKNDKLYIYVGEMGKDYSSVVDLNRPLGGYNGGGSGGKAYQIAGGGGGATDVRLEISGTGNWDDFNSLKSRIMVAGAGGGTSNWLYTVSGGYGGGLTGGTGILNENSASHRLATGGTQISGGMRGQEFDYDENATNGKFGQGGNSQVQHGGGGGSGYYGGGGGSGSVGVSSGAGGSSFISGHIGCVAIKKESTEENVQPKDGCTDGTNDINCSFHYSGKVFTDTLMLGGNEEMSTHDGNNTMTGNIGNGYAKIIFVEV